MSTMLTLCVWGDGRRLEGTGVGGSLNNPSSELIPLLDWNANHGLPWPNEGF